MRLIEGVATVEDVDAFLDDLDVVAGETGATVQAFDARYVMGEAHLRRALELADRAFERGENVARERGVEVLLYVAGRRQIDRALAMGVGEGEHRVVVLVDGGNEGDAAARIEDLLSPADALGVEHAEPKRVQEFFGIDGDELAATDGTLQDVVLERVALL
ncbi:MAG: KEOPS complex subunit Cgi121, partial [Halobacteriales archaeon]